MVYGDRKINLVADAFLAFLNGREEDGFQVYRLAGDASNRSYYRVTAREGEASWMVMKLASEPLKSEEGQQVTQVERLPFSDVAAYLAAGKVAVPEIYLEDLDKGFLILEDLGDLTLEKALAAGRSKVEFYQWAIDALVDMHAWTVVSPDLSCIAFRRSFDRDLLMWEFEHFFEWGLVEFTGSAPDSGDAATLRGFFSEVTAQLTSMRQGFVHRDYQSRNLMIHEGRIRVIDFQDALQGPFIYDMVALLRDSYVKFTPEELDYFLSYYREVGKDVLPDMPDMEGLRRLFHLQALQRKLKDAGRFVYIDRVKKNPKFLKNIPQSLAYVDEAFRALPEFDQVRRVLAKYLPEPFCR